MRRAPICYRAAMLFIFMLCVGFGGVVLLVRAELITVQIHNWCDRLYERYPSVNPSPSARRRALGLKSMKVLFQIAGIVLILLSALDMLRVAVNSV